MILCPTIALTGIYLSSLTKRRLELLKLLSLFFSETERLCRYGTYSVIEVFILLRKSRQFGRLSFLEYICESFSPGANLKELWSEAIELFGNEASDKRSIEALISFGDSFGKENKESFCRRCSEFYCFFSEAAEKEALQREKNREIIVYSAILASVAVFFIFI